MTKEMISAFLQEMEEKHHIKILYAVDSGSLSFGYASPESDTDVRFIYVNRPEYYFSLTPKADTVNFMNEDHTLDVEGFDLKKALALMMKTNPIESDWLHSDLVYIKESGFKEKMLEFERMYYNPKHAMYHFHSISVKHNDRYFKEGITLKRFIYFMRGLLACVWIERHGCHPPVNMDELIDAVVEDADMRESAHRLLATKRLGRAHNNDPVDDCLVEYTKGLREYYEKFLPEFKANKPVGDEATLVKFLMEMIGFPLKDTL